jgi:hypothetical protein
MDYTVDHSSSIFFNLNSAETNDEMQKIAQEVSLLSDSMTFDLIELFARCAVLQIHVDG